MVKNRNNIASLLEKKEDAEGLLLTRMVSGSEREAVKANGVMSEATVVEDSLLRQQLEIISKQKSCCR